MFSQFRDVELLPRVVLNKGQSKLERMLRF
ncbi:hypothetical protein LOK49_LG14G01169 [Camellia lanceoleosa]|uniref:Uncharacterized protein n=1 Tax=Camellia lanceoleosa TaxID=1840588 RepID=A0ACC0FCL1_9ERIC|nr:hypothetical protein LOK49_LG14G01169 [Camellia lanceoleosa]